MMVKYYNIVTDLFEELTQEKFDEIFGLLLAVQRAYPKEVTMVREKIKKERALSDERVM